ncbi:unknown protein [Paenibacillus amylolyticus]|uniref:Uncharacterized protein n=1 Tax=Paenibacillus amylolyticus TaxID=1451 RepID=A0A124DYT2_PAEAM|nr:unknown protein [Paenibacillus amylolyticus]
MRPGVHIREKHGKNDKLAKGSKSCAEDGLHKMYPGCAEIRLQIGAFSLRQEPQIERDNKHQNDRGQQFGAQPDSSKTMDKPPGKGANDHQNNDPNGGLEINLGSQEVTDLTDTYGCTYGKIK